MRFKKVKKKAENVILKQLEILEEGKAIEKTKALISRKFGSGDENKAIFG